MIEPWFMAKCREGSGTAPFREVDCRREQLISEEKQIELQGMELVSMGYENIF